MLTDSDIGSQIEDVEAIDRYMRTTPLKTSEAFQIKDAYIRWYDKSSWWDKNQSGSFFDEIRTRRNQLNIANQPTETKKAEVRQVIATGVTAEEMQGGKKPAIDAQTGRVGSQVKKPTVAATPSTQAKAGDPPGPVALESGKIYPTIRQGSGDRVTVKLWQSIIGASPVDGFFGPDTVAKTKAWQKAHGLGADGVVGPDTWKAAGTGPAPIFKPETKDTATIFAPPSPKPEFKPSPKPAPKPSTPKPAPTPDKQKPLFVDDKKLAPTPAKEKKSFKAKGKEKAIQAAGMLDISSWPLWGKVLAGVTIAGGVVAAVMGKKVPKRLFH